MKYLAAAILTLMVCASAAHSQTQPKPPTIDVVGTAEVLVPPDEVVFNLDVTKRNKDMNIAKQEADAALRKIIDLTRQFNIKPENVKTDYISVEKRYESIRDPKNRIFDEDGDEIGTRVFLGYDVSTTVIVRLTDLKRFEEFFSKALETGVTEIGRVSFESSQMIEKRKQAREMAMKAAYEKASAMAAAIGQTIGKAIYIQEERPASVQSNSANYANTFVGVTTATESVATFSPGSIKISSTVSVTFLLN